MPMPHGFSDEEMETIIAIAAPFSGSNCGILKSFCLAIGDVLVKRYGCGQSTNQE